MPQRLGEGAEPRKGGVGRWRPEPLLDVMAGPWLTVGHGDEAQDLGRDPEQPHHLARGRNPLQRRPRWRTRSAGSARHRPVIRPVVEKAILTGFMESLDRLDQVVPGHRLGIEHERSSATSICGAF
jgi:hypothetical protein